MEENNAAEIENAFSSKDKPVSKFKQVASRFVNRIRSSNLSEEPVLAVPTDPKTAYDYAYHATRVRSLKSIAKSGLQPRRESGSKEPELWFIQWELGGMYAPEHSRRALVRVRWVDVPELAQKSANDNGFMNTHGFRDIVATHESISPDKLDYSLDDGKTWRPVVTPTNKI